VCAQGPTRWASHSAWAYLLWLRSTWLYSYSGYPYHPYKVRVLQCVGHFLQELAERGSTDYLTSKTTLLRSDYPLLLLHAQVRSTR